MNEYISRQAVLDLYKEYQPSMAVKVYEFGERLKALELAPTIEAQPVKHGRWINTNNPNQLRCSNCDIIHMIAQYPNGKISYCPNCGSYMKDGGSE